MKNDSGSDFLIGAAIGSGSTALAAERGGADMLLAINAGRLRNMGIPSIASMLPILDSPQLTEKFAEEELLIQCKKPVYLGVSAWEQEADPEIIAERVAQAGFAGAANFPSCMHYTKPFRQILSRSGRGIEKEVELLKAVQDKGLSTIFYCANRTQARMAADVGLDIVCLNLGWNAGGAVGHQSHMSLEEVAAMAREVSRLVKRINPDIKFVLEGGPISTPDDLAKVISLVPIDGYIGGSTIERMPVEVSVADLINGFRHASARSVEMDDDTRSLLKWSAHYRFAGKSKNLIPFLERLKSITKFDHPILLLAERGLHPAPVLEALSNSNNLSRKPNIVQYDVAGEDFPTRARTILFGFREGNRQRAPVLADETVDLLVIYSPEKLTPAIQRRLAKALRDGFFRATGYRKSLSVAPKVILACEAPLANNIKKEDLLAIGLEQELADFLSGWIVRMPPLRERIEDIFLIIEEFTQRSFGSKITQQNFSSAALQKIKEHIWPGNESELKSVIGSLAEIAVKRKIQPEDINLDLYKSQEVSPGDADKSEKTRILDYLWRHGYNRSRTAEALGISRKTLYNKLKKYGLNA